MFAQFSEKASDPAAWSELAHAIGPAGFLSVLLLLIVGALGYVCYRATIGPNGFVRAVVSDLHEQAKATMTHLTESMERLEDANKAEKQQQSDLRLCGGQFADGMAAIGKATGADVTSQTATIRATLARAI